MPTGGLSTVIKPAGSNRAEKSDTRVHEHAFNSSSIEGIRKSLIPDIPEIEECRENDNHADQALGPVPVRNE